MVFPGRLQRDADDNYSQLSLQDIYICCIYVAATGGVLGDFLVSDTKDGNAPFS